MLKEFRSVELIDVGTPLLFLVIVFMLIEIATLDAEDLEKFIIVFSFTKKG